MRPNYPGFFDHHHRSMQSEQLSGVWNAVVTDNKDPEKKGRVKVKFLQRDDTLQTDWIRIATLMSGKDMGTLFIPEVNDEVLVAFLMGRFDQPVVIGSLWNAKEMPPAGNDKNDIRKIKTRSGHEITFDDKNGEGTVTVKTTKGHSLTISDKDKTIKLATSDTLQTLTLDETGGKVTVKAASGASIELSKTGDATITGQKTISIKGTEVKVEASASMTLQSNGMMELKSNGLISLKGSLVKIN
ncbi:phage baseplate assembly protein V [Paenibacillus soyae]|uniref:Phage baseplate assembly protein V n=1 Tax=Paenibacillus soyae TaxID=2969249 RepID=A0A9X2S6X8_9BACL|nr:phage baseplate assembly protein V [Paenibacillus soyae]MCR2802445.1 phage baseplate assembly protein V [Paenibacillus soyae]